MIFIERFISDIKNVVVMIVAAEFLKNFLIGDKFKKYITVCVNILVIGFIISHITSKQVTYEISTDIPNFESGVYENRIKTSYEERVSLEVKNKLTENKISVYEIETQANDDYSINKITVTVNGKKEETEKIIKGMKPEHYEIIITDKN